MRIQTLRKVSFGLVSDVTEKNIDYRRRFNESASSNLLRRRRTEDDGDVVEKKTENSTW